MSKFKINLKYQFLKTNFINFFQITGLKKFKMQFLDFLNLDILRSQSLKKKQKVAME